MLLLIAFYVVGIAFILLSIYLRYWRGKRQFDRRNAAGNETFRSYGHSLKARYSENAVQFLYMALTVIGAILLLMAIFDAKDIVRVTHF